MAAHNQHGALDNFHLDIGLHTKVRNVILFLLLVSAAAMAAGYFLDPKQFFHSYLAGFAWSTRILLGALFFLMAMYLTGAAWSVTVRRFSETMAATIPFGLILFVPLALGVHELYEWSHADVVANDKILQGKAMWLNERMFWIKGAVMFAIWSFFGLGIYRNSTAQDTDKDIRHMHNSSKYSAPGLLLVFLATSFAMFDWIMSLNPHWYSTIYGIYMYAGGGLASMCTLVLISLGFRNAGVLKNSITEEHYHDLGKWIFAVTVFWTYTAFSQYMLYWYANIPEETIFFKERFTGSWKLVSQFLVFGHFLFPMFFLITRKTKRNLATLAFMACWMLAMDYLDIHWNVMPNFHKAGFSPHWMDLAAPVACASFYAFFFWNRLKNHAIVPVGDARLYQCLAHHNI
jgi:hypothetical protein